jgi:hypothetical protein
MTTGQNGHPLNAQRKRKRKRDSDGCVGSPATLNLDTFTMSDEEHDVETFDTADAGASHTIPMQAGSVRKGGFMVRSRATSDLFDEWMNREPNLRGLDDAAGSRDARFARRETDTARTIGNDADAKRWRLF